MQAPCSTSSFTLLAITPCFLAPSFIFALTPQYSAACAHSVSIATHNAETDNLLPQSPTAPLVGVVDPHSSRCFCGAEQTALSKIASAEREIEERERERGGGEQGTQTDTATRKDTQTHRHAPHTWDKTVSHALLGVKKIGMVNTKMPKNQNNLCHQYSRHLGHQRSGACAPCSKGLNMHSPRSMQDEKKERKKERKIEGGKG